MNYFLFKKTVGVFLSFLSEKIPIKNYISYNKGLNLKIGVRVSFGGNVFLGGDNQIEIGDDTMIAYGVKIITATHDYNLHPMWQKKQQDQ